MLQLLVQFSKDQIDSPEGLQVILVFGLLLPLIIASLAYNLYKES